MCDISGIAKKMPKNMNFWVNFLAVGIKIEKEKKVFETFGMIRRPRQTSKYDRVK